MEPAEIKSAMAGTLESMDCMVTITRPAEGRVIEIAGSGAVRFKAAMERKINGVLDGLGVASGIKVSVQDNGALDVVLGARVEAACRRFLGGGAR
ncbi:citrate lyase ACP [Synergistales bacterium]|nr:citrate lyase ACP [Synergistales bacterium]